MSNLDEHPSVGRFRERAAAMAPEPTPALDAKELRNPCLAAGADDVGFVDCDRPALAAEREDILSFFPQTQSLIASVVRMNREPVAYISSKVFRVHLSH
jgi:hypothetical protein